MSGVATAIGASAVIGYVGSQNAAKTQASAADNATAVQQQNLAYQQQVQAPYQAAGVSALAGMQNPAFQQGFTTADFQQSPGYQFALQQGQNALNASQAAQGNQVSGAGLTALDQYNQGMANQQYQQAFNNYNTTQSLQYGRLAQLAAGGAGANQAMGTAGQNYANAAGNNMMSAANANAAGGMYGTNMLQSGITGLANSLGSSGSAAAPPGSGYQTMSQFANAPQSNLTNPSSNMFQQSAPATTSYSLGN